MYTFIPLDAAAPSQILLLAAPVLLPVLAVIIIGVFIIVRKLKKKK